SPRGPARVARAGTNRRERHPPRCPLRAHIPSATALALAALASIVTLAWSGVYPPPADAPLHNGILAEARGWSIVTAFWVVPLGIAALLRARSGSSVAHTVWAGTMAYLVYTFLELAVSGPFTPLFLVY